MKNLGEILEKRGKRMKETIVENEVGMERKTAEKRTKNLDRMVKNGEKS